MMKLSLVINGNLHPVLHCLQVIADYWSNFVLSTGWVWYPFLSYSFSEINVNIAISYITKM